MNELVEDLKGIAVISDDFVVAEHGDTHEAAVASHGRNLNVFLRHCEWRGAVLIAQKSLIT